MPNGSDSVAVDSRRPLMRAQKSVTYEREARSAAFTPLCFTKSRAAATGAWALAEPLRYFVGVLAPTDNPDPICSNTCTHTVKHTHDEHQLLHARSGIQMYHPQNTAAAKRSEPKGAM